MNPKPKREKPPRIDNLKIVLKGGREVTGVAGSVLKPPDAAPYDPGFSTGVSVWASRAKSQRPSGCLR
jgi:hypothetical protein